MSMDTHQAHACSRWTGTCKSVDTHGQGCGVDPHTHNPRAHTWPGHASTTHTHMCGWTHESPMTTPRACRDIHVPLVGARHGHTWPWPGWGGRGRPPRAGPGPRAPGGLRGAGPVCFLLIPLEPEFNGRIAISACQDDHARGGVCCNERNRQFPRMHMYIWGNVQGTRSAHLAMGHVPSIYRGMFAGTQSSNEYMGILKEYIWVNVAWDPKSQ